MKTLEKRFFNPLADCLSKLNYSIFRSVFSISSSTLQEPINLTKLVVWTMWFHARKWAQRRSALIAVLCFILSCSPVCWSCWIIDPPFIALVAASSASQDWMWTSLCKCALIFTVAIFQLLKGLVIHAPPVLWSDFPLFLQTLQKAPS